MHHLHHLQQILLAQLRQRLSQLLHIHIPVLTLPWPLLLRTGRRRCCSRSTIAPRLVAHRPTLPQRLQQRTLRIPERHLVHTLIPLPTLKVQIMRNNLLPTLRAPDRRERDVHIELSPALLADLEGRLAEDLTLALAKGLVQDVGGLFVAGGGHLVAVGVLQEDVDGPGAHGVAFGFGGVGGDVLLGDELNGAFDLVGHG